ncbi:hypothetical protein [Bifidobacterium myosotis]|uniref:Uncharacterized protein n=1 Tax=Bifidobacterium myosotis TaxID=1630166 RepID=A0A5M9ZFQ8_9BIFI|nr:hypothetical protein [Bifidobacterium myosotis]KAA8825086.1 hypothetical protein EMO91_12725 [Bifidobacterium myosotis]
METMLLCVVFLLALLDIGLLRLIGLLSAISRDFDLHRQTAERMEGDLLALADAPAAATAPRMEDGRTNGECDGNAGPATGPGTMPGAGRRDEGIERRGPRESDSNPGRNSGESTHRDSRTPTG